MKLRNKYLIFIIANLSLPIHTQTDIPTTPIATDTQRLEKQLEQLTEQISNQQEHLAVLIQLMFTQALEQAQRKQYQLEKLHAQEAQEQEKQAQFDALPSWRKYSQIIAGTTIDFTKNNLLPMIKAQLTSMLARKIVEQVLNATDFCTGTLPEKAGIPIIAFRFGEWLSLDELQREYHKSERILQKNKEYQQLQKEHKKLQQANLVASNIMNLSQKVHDQRELTEKINDERIAKQNAQEEKDRTAALYPNETPLEREEREKKAEEIKIRIQKIDRTYQENLKTQRKNLEDAKEARENEKAIQALKLLLAEGTASKATSTESEPRETALPTRCASPRMRHSNNVSPQPPVITSHCNATSEERLTAPIQHTATENTD